jgi:hypothetical protein
MERLSSDSQFFSMPGHTGSRVIALMPAFSIALITRWEDSGLMTAQIIFTDSPAEFLYWSYHRCQV